MKNKFCSLCLGLLVLFFISSYLSGKEETDQMTKENQKKLEKLPEPRKKGALSLEECIQKRRSKRSFDSKELTREEISQLLWSLQGITDKTRGFRAAPSAGALYPLEIYAVKSEGFYHYTPHDHTLKRLSKKDLREPLTKAALGQRYIAQAPFTIVICAVYERICSRYGERGVMYTHIETGHAAQNLLLQAVALNLGSVPIGAFREAEVTKALSLPEAHKPVYILPVGQPLN